MRFFELAGGAFHGHDAATQGDSGVGALTQRVVSIGFGVAQNVFELR